jgi:hypothetical protein
VPRTRTGDPLPTITRTELGLAEYGPTPTPAYVEAGILAVRSADQLAAELAALDPQERAELLRKLASTTPAEDPETPTATPNLGPGGAEDPRVIAHSIRQSDIARRVRVGRILRGMK